MIKRRPQEVISHKTIDGLFILQINYIKLLHLINVLVVFSQRVIFYFYHSDIFVV